MDPNCAVLQLIGKHVPFEIAVGMNGKVWVNSHEPKNIILISNAILNSEYLNRKQCEAMVRSLVAKISNV